MASIYLLNSRGGQTKDKAFLSFAFIVEWANTNPNEASQSQSHESFCEFISPRRGHMC